jgi:hypothetical protein
MKSMNFGFSFVRIDGATSYSDMLKIEDQGGKNKAHGNISIFNNTKFERS